MQAITTTLAFGIDIPTGVATELRPRRPKDLWTAVTSQPIIWGHCPRTPAIYAYGKISFTGGTVIIVVLLVGLGVKESEVHSSVIGRCHHSFIRLARQLYGVVLCEPL